MGNLRHASKDQTLVSNQFGGKNRSRTFFFDVHLSITTNVKKSKMYQFFFGNIGSFLKMTCLVPSLRQRPPSEMSQKNPIVRCLADGPDVK